MKQSKNLIENKKKADKKDNFIIKDKQSRRENISESPSFNNIRKNLAKKLRAH